MSTQSIDCARLAFEAEYPQLASRAKAACKRVPPVDRRDAIQSWLCQFWERFAEFCSTEGIADPEIAIACLSLIRNRRRSEAKQTEDLDSLEIPGCLDPIDGLLVAGFIQGDSDSELSAITNIPRRSIPAVAIATLERVVPLLTLRACCARLARLQASAPHELDDLGEIMDYLRLRVSILLENENDG